MTAQTVPTDSFPAPNVASSSKGLLWTGRILSTLVVLFFLMDSVLKLFKPRFVVEGSQQLGYPESTIFGIGVALLLATVFYVIPRTSILGAVLLTGYLGGAVASGVRAQTPIFNDVFPIVFAILAWGGLWLRDKRLQQLLPLVKSGK